MGLGRRSGVINDNEAMRAVMHHPVNRRGGGHRAGLGSFLVAGMRPTPSSKTSCLIRLFEILRCYRLGCFVDTREEGLTYHVE